MSTSHVTETPWVRILLWGMIGWIAWGRQTQWETIQKILEQVMPPNEDGLGAYMALALGWGKSMVPILLLHWVVLNSHTASTRGFTSPATLSTCNERENI